MNLEKIDKTVEDAKREFHVFERPSADNSKALIEHVEELKSAYTELQAACRSLIVDVEAVEGQFEGEYVFETDGIETAIDWPNLAIHIHNIRGLVK